MCKNNIPYIKSSRPMKLKQDAVSGKKKEKINLGTNKWWIIIDLKHGKMKLKH